MLKKEQQQFLTEKFYNCRSFIKQLLSKNTMDKLLNFEVAYF